MNQKPNNQTNKADITHNHLLDEYKNNPNKSLIQIVKDCNLIIPQKTGTVKQILDVYSYKEFISMFDIDEINISNIQLDGLYSESMEREIKILMALMSMRIKSMSGKEYIKIGHREQISNLHTLIMSIISNKICIVKIKESSKKVYYGFYVHPLYEINHINQIKFDNRYGNLEIVPMWLNKKEYTFKLFVDNKKITQKQLDELTQKAKHGGIDEIEFQKEINRLVKTNHL